MIKINHVLQVANDCVVASIETVTQYLGKKYDGRIMMRHKYYDKGIIFCLAAKLMKDAGYKVKIYTANLMLLDPSEYSLSAEKIVQILKERKNAFGPRGQKMLEATISALEAGVELIFSEPDLNLLDEYIKKNIPVVLVVNAPSLYLTRGDVYGGHCVVVCGNDGGRYQIADPGRAEIQNFSAKQLLFGMYGRKPTDVTGWLMEIGV